MPYVFLPSPGAFDTADAPEPQPQSFEPEPLEPEPEPLEPQSLEPLAPELEAEAESASPPLALARGARGASVFELQRRLAEHGHDPGPLDGIFGALTDAALRAFQQARGLPVDGVATAATWARLLAPSPWGTPAIPGVPAPATPGTGAGKYPDWSARSADERMRHAMGVLVERYRYTPNAAAGIVGNLYAESEVIPNRIEGSSARTPMRASDFDGRLRDHGAEAIMNRNSAARVGPKLPGCGLAQWTSSNRRVGLFRHAYQGRVLGAAILFDMDAQLDYLVYELRTSYQSVNAVLLAPGVTLNDASDEVVYRFERPAKVLDRPRHDPQVQEVFTVRRAHSQRALRALQSRA